MPSQEDKLSALSPRDRQVLKEISEGLTDPKKIAEKLEIKEVSVISLAEGLAEKGLIKLEKRVEEVYALTEEGARYAEIGLPERRILEIAGVEGVPISEIKDPALKVGIGWLKKKGWANLEAGKIKPTGDDAPPGKDEVILEALSFQGETGASALDAEALKVLKSRGLVEPNTQKSWSFEIRDLGRSAIEKAALRRGAETSQPTSYVNQVTSDMIKNGVWEGRYLDYKGARYEVRPYDVTLPAERIYPGKVHPYQRLLSRMREIMLEMGFTEIKGEIVQSSYWNFDALFQPQDHPAREMQDTFYLDSKAEIPDYSQVKEMHESGGEVGSTGWGGRWDPEVARREVLRTHTTSITIKYLADHPNPPVKAFSIDRVYRREAIDPTHTPEFEQLEGVIMDEGLSFANLLGVLQEFYAKMGFDEVRFRPGYFPYTEPSVEPEVYIEGLGWVELGGAGVFRREVTAPFGIDHPVLAWGLGVGRLAMLRLGLKDLRLLYQSDVGWLRDEPSLVRM
ncbi:phenylalanine--tRNA ligase subunit alpha [Methanocrinis sp.]|uniref:phenylalanine--tRNA ligase subunit alpha n=1 Tax=Methanocrinis sp. TaxID=3101522 RepID=UPI003D0E02AC